jgi:chromosome segregation ATPase
MDEANEKVAGLEKEVEAANATITALSMCVTSIAIAIRDLSSDVQLVSEVISALSSKKNDPLKNMLSTQSKKDDDDYIN